MPENVSVAIALGAGLLSFLSPCVLPMVPVYLASLYGPGIYDTGAAGIRLPLFLHSFSFVAGFSVIFVSLGALAGLTGFAFSPSSDLLNKIAGGMLIAFGIFILAALKVPWLNYEKHLTPSLGNNTGYFRSFVIGAAFSLGWTACIGPILGGILTMAAVRATAWQGASLLAVYSLGLGIPFLVMGVAFDSIMPFAKRIGRHSRLIHIISGLLLIAMGVLFLTNKMSWFSSLAG